MLFFRFFFNYLKRGWGVISPLTGYTERGSRLNVTGLGLPPPALEWKLHEDEGFGYFVH